MFRLRDAPTQALPRHTDAVADLVGKFPLPPGVRAEVLVCEDLQGGWVARISAGHRQADVYLPSEELRSVYMSRSGSMPDFVFGKMMQAMNALFPPVVPFRIGTRHPKRLRIKPGAWE